YTPHPVSPPSSPTRRSSDLLGPVAPGLRLVPIDECHRRVRRQLIDFVVAAPRPDVAVMLKPVDRLLGDVWTWRRYDKVDELPPRSGERTPELHSLTHLLCRR